ncbi:MAG: LysR family transcriptional regulator [Candidatus Competibacteraceae bacterium]|uniref:Transcriptional regulator, LysR family n=1 Tax=Candidatus Contendobacter odensis Run_B_J11 TaxID=1400861 RepID=A0A7U7GFI3_9GAMM|nr:LysR family transcriptional regulator [Candidatus Contendobacter odensis]MBK8536434.1 LysR family transcriptional regulator [Candidatus Competibacteraceae bacterium]MBK8753198.1 LysR family transcriptional regulator [Candidatus Competibacteraceae bacterium]CDH47450.1 Transcriptional regulator, LysR family [Candidatus Contendobacter odensis Run_B_J11]
MDRLHLMSVFVAVAEEEGFAGGARRLGMSPPAVTRSIAALEARLGVKLLHRTTRFVRVTEAGQRYLDDARRILSEVDEADEAVAGIHAEPRGYLAVTAPVLFGRMFVMPGIVEYLQQYPAMTVSALFLDRVVNLLEEGFDVGVRIGELPDSSMKAIRVGQVRQVVCASPSYLAEHGQPNTPLELANHLMVAASAVSPVVDWKFVQDAQTTVVRVKPRLTVSSNAAAIEAVRHGFGITRLLSYQIAPYLASGQLKTLLSEFEPGHLPIHVIHREGRSAAAKVRTFVDLMAARLRADPALNG